MRVGSTPGPSGWRRGWPATRTERAEKTERADRSWLTKVEVVRKAEGRVPVEVAVIAERDAATHPFAFFAGGSDLVADALR